MSSKAKAAGAKPTAAQLEQDDSSQSDNASQASGSATSKASYPAAAAGPKPASSAIAVPGAAAIRKMNGDRKTGPTDTDIATSHNDIISALAQVQLDRAEHDRAGASLIPAVASSHFRHLAYMAIGALGAHAAFCEYAKARGADVTVTQADIDDPDSDAIPLLVWLFVCWRTANPRNSLDLYATNASVAGASVPLDEAHMWLVARLGAIRDAYSANGQHRAFEALPFAEQLELVKAWFRDAGLYVRHVLTQLPQRPTTVDEYGLALRPHAQAIAAIQFTARHAAEINNTNPHAGQRQLGRRPTHGTTNAGAPPSAPAPRVPVPAQPAQPTPARAAGGSPTAEHRHCSRCGEAHPFGQHTDPKVPGFCKTCNTRHPKDQHVNVNGAGGNNNGNVGRADDLAPA